MKEGFTFIAALIAIIVLGVCKCDELEKQNEKLVKENEKLIQENYNLGQNIIDLKWQLGEVGNIVCEEE